MMILHLSGCMKGSKNRIIITKQGRRFPAKPFVLWREEMLRQIAIQYPKMEPFTRPVAISVYYYPGDNIRRDSTGILDGLFHVFEKSGIVKDDYLIQKINWLQMEVDKENPRCSIEFSDYAATQLP